ncbi:breast cancer type 1 susceptibility protein homolog [Vespa velutina]|uniref:breast cancer type 1 susceptibility protein homolog n=1 Tax=Vespa velutina TaxID=202808 RepID=UPI001FB1D963|nr:breast cancer type 1 susceptibility protein homolog [Vespa velutina]
MTEDQIASIDTLYDAVKSIHNCLQCRICLDMISSPVKTRCGHSFCRTCIGTVLSQKNTKCPLCNTGLQRRSISKDKHTEKCINCFEKLVNAIHEDVNIDILSYKKNPRNTREGYATPSSKCYNASSSTKTIEERKNNGKISSFFKKKNIVEKEEEEGCTSRQDISNKINETCKKYNKNNTIKKNDYADERKERRSSSTDGLSGVYPLLSSPQRNLSSKDETSFMKEKRIKNWLKNLPNAEQFEKPTLSPNNMRNNCLDDTATVVSGISLMSSSSNIKVEKLSYESEHSMTKKHEDNVKQESFNSMKSRVTNNARGKGYKRKATTRSSFPEQKIKDDSTGIKLKYEMIHARIKERSNVEKSMKKNSHGENSLTSNIDSIDSNKQLGSVNTTKETWNRVVKFGKEMRTKKKKLKSLDVSVQSTSGFVTRTSDEFLGKKVTRNEQRRKSSTGILGFVTSSRDKSDESINLIDRRDDDNRIFPSCSISHDISFSNDQMEEKDEQKVSQNTSFISLEKEGRVPIMSLRREQMNDIIGVTTSNSDKITYVHEIDQYQSYQKDQEDQETISKKKLSLKKRDDSKNSTIINFSNVEQSPRKVTPVKINLEERYDILCKSQILLSPRNVRTPIKVNENPRLNESMSKLSLKKNQTCANKSNDIAISPGISKFSNVKCNLMEQMNRNNKLSKDTFKRVTVNEIIDNVNTRYDNDERRRNVTEENNDPNELISTNYLVTNDKKTRIVPFNKLGKVFKNRRKVKFYKYGPIRKESIINTLSGSFLNNSNINLITLQGSEDSLVIDKALDEACNLDNRGSSISLIVEKDVKNYPIELIEERNIKCSSKNSTQDSLGVLLVSLKEPISEDKTVNVVDCNERYVKFNVDESTKKNIINLSKSANEVPLRAIDKNGIRSKPVITSIVRMMSPENDSQLKFLNLESMTDTILPVKLRICRESTPSEFGTKSERKDDTSIKINKEMDKRKLIVHNGKEIKSEREVERSSNDNDSNYSESIDNVTQIVRFNEGHNKIRKNHEDATIISLTSESSSNMDNKKSKNEYKRIALINSSSDTDNSLRKKRRVDVEDHDKDVLSLESDNNMDNKKVMMSNNMLNESKGKYKRIELMANTGSDSDNSSARKRKINIEGNIDEKKVETSKKKRITSEDSDDDNFVNKIVNDWCNDFNTSQRSIGKDNLEKLKSTKVISNKPMTTMIPQSIVFDSWNNFGTPVKTIPEKEEPEKLNNYIIDKVKSIRMNENEITTKEDRLIEKIDDHSNEIEIITNSLTTNFFTDENLIDDTKDLLNKDKKYSIPLTTSSCIETNDFLADSNDSKMEDNLKEKEVDGDDDDDDDDDDETLIENFNSSNKENETARYIINNTKDYSIKKDIITSKEKAENKRATLISGKDKYENDKGKGQIIGEQKDTTSCDYDSLLDVTQHQLLLNALEEDLFGIDNLQNLGKSKENIKTLSQENRLESSLQTPLKYKKNHEKERTNLRNKNAEDISSDDEIIENTPQSDKKFMEVDRSTNFKARKSLTMSQTTTPGSRKNFQVAKTTTATKTMSTTTTTPSSSVAAKVKKTPIDQNKIRPLYQSTPKTIQTALNRNCETSNFLNENKKSLKSNSNSNDGGTSRTNETRNVKNQRDDKKELCFVWSSLAINQIESIKKLAYMIGANWTQNFNSTVTHVIVSTNDTNNAATKTLKFLQGIAYRKYVVGYKWVADCLKEGTLMNEEPYEAVDCYTLEAGPRKSRLRQSDLFDGFTFLCIEPFQNITVTQFQDLLKAMGATIVQNIDSLAIIKEKHRVILIENEVHTDEVVANWYAETTAIPVFCDWVVECISQYKLVSCYTHLHEVVQEDVLKLGYPEQMIDPEEFNSTCDTSIGH